MGIKQIITENNHYKKASITIIFVIFFLEGVNSIITIFHVLLQNFKSPIQELISNFSFNYDVRITIIVVLVFPLLVYLWKGKAFSIAGLFIFIIYSFLLDKEKISIVIESLTSIGMGNYVFLVIFLSIILLFIKAFLLLISILLCINWRMFKMK